MHGDFVSRMTRITKGLIVWTFQEIPLDKRKTHTHLHQHALTAEMAIVILVLLGHGMAWSATIIDQKVKCWQAPSKGQGYYFRQTEGVTRIRLIFWVELVQLVESWSWFCYVNVKLHSAHLHGMGASSKYLHSIAEPTVSISINLDSLMVHWN